jgi:hypothetical protein
MSQFPDNVPTKYAGDRTDFLRVKRDTFGAMRSEYASIAVADSASAGTTYGLVPFQAGFRISYGSKFFSPDLDTTTNVTWNLGFLYEDTALTSDDNAFATLLSGQAAAVLSFDEVAGMSFEATANGWVVATLAAGPVSIAGNIESVIDFTYDS